METSGGADVEVISTEQSVPEGRSLGARLANDLLVGERQPARGLGANFLLRHHRHRNRAVEAVVKKAEQPLAHPEQDVRGGAGNRNFDARLEAVPELPKIGCHDLQSAEPVRQGYPQAPPQ